MTFLRTVAFFFILLALGCNGGDDPSTDLKVGSKKFTESVILGEVLSQLARSGGADAEHLKEIGGTRVLWNALKKGDIDMYPRVHRHNHTGDTVR